MKNQHLSNETQIRIRYGETDQMGVVYHGNYPLYLEMGHIEWLRKLGISYKKTQGKIYSRSPDYIDNGFDVKWRDHQIGVLLAIQKLGKVRRKEFTPGELQLETEYNDPDKFYAAVATGLDGHPLNKCLMSMLDNLKDNKPI